MDVKIEADAARRERMEWRQTKVKAASTVYLIAILIYVIVKGSTMKELPELNNLGDFLAGAFSPLAFFWLVYGYFQQQEELSLNTEALKLQANELANQSRELGNQVEQHKELVEVTRQQLKHERRKFEHQIRRERQAVAPYLTIDVSRMTAGDGEDVITLHLHNEGQRARDIKFGTSREDIAFRGMVSLNPHEKANQHWKGRALHENVSFYLFVQYYDGSGDIEYGENYEVKISGSQALIDSL